MDVVGAEAGSPAAEEVTLTTAIAERSSEDDPGEEARHLELEPREKGETTGYAAANSVTN